MIRPQDFDSDDTKIVKWLVMQARKGNIEIEKQIKELDEHNADAIVRDALLKRAKQLEDNDELSVENKIIVVGCHITAKA